MRGRGANGNRSRISLCLEDCLRIAATLESLPVFRAWLRHYCERLEIEAEAIHDLVLAVSEAFTNVVVHGIPESRARIEVRIRISREGARVLLTYPGVPFVEPPPALPNEWATHGRGCYIIHALMDGVTYRYERGQAQTELHKRWA